MPDQYVGVEKLVKDLIVLAGQGKKIAFVLQGGGARAAWFGGALEAVEAEVRRQQPNLDPNLRFAPDLIVGTSGGALAGLAYFCDLMNPGTYGRYANRQSCLWRDLSTGNEAAFSLLENAGMLELLSGSKKGGSVSMFPAKSQPYSQSPVVGAIANMQEALSPHYNFQKLFVSREKLRTAVQELDTAWKTFTDGIDALSLKPVADAVKGLHIKDDWTADVAAIQAKVDVVKADAAKVQSLLNEVPPKIGKAVKVPLLKDSGKLVGEVLSDLADLGTKLLQVPFVAANALFSQLGPIFHNLENLLKAVKNAVKAVFERVKEIVLHLDDFVSFVTTTVNLVKKHSALMNTKGLLMAIHEVLRQAVPTTVNATATAGELDQAIFKHWAERRALKVADARVRAPELIMTASNISAGRVALLALCDPNTADKLGGLHTWVVGLDQAWMNVSSGSGKKQTATAPSSRWVFGAWSNEYQEPVKVKQVGKVGKASAGSTIPNLDETLREAAKAGGARSSVRTAVAARPKVAARATRSPLAATSAAETDPKGSVGPVPRAGGTVDGGGGSGGSRQFKPALGLVGESTPFVNLGVSEIRGESLIAGAALTSASIPIAFPPRWWRFTNTWGTYKHWMVDGGLCDNRPIQQAVDAGADVIVSFEQTPLSRAFQDIPTDDDKPDISEVASDAIINTPMTSAFYRFLESHVGANQSSGRRMWRISPAKTAKDAKSIDVYDFNGHWEGGTLRMGLYDWFMRGYLDARGSANSTGQPYDNTKDDAVLGYTQTAASHDQLGDVAGKDASPGFFVVDYALNHPHPGYA